MTKIQNIFKKKVGNSVPIWLMRQAGRYLPEYKKIRKQFNSFMEFCSNSEMSSEVTLQPIDRFDFDAAIIFSDILTIPYALGQKVEFISGKGPILEKIDNWDSLLEPLNIMIPETLQSTYDTVKLTRSALAKDKSLFGFAGAPWTLMTYMLGETKSNRYAKTIDFAEKRPETFYKLQTKLINIISDHLIAQVKAGADIVQIFDSWAAAVPNDKMQDWVINPIVKIVNRVHEATSVPVIVFAKDTEICYQQISQKVANKEKIGFSLGSKAALSTPVDNHVLQGGLSPETLAVGGYKLETEIKNILQAHANTPYIFNLGHGILPHTPISHVEQLIEIVKGHNAQKDSSCII